MTNIICELQDCMYHNKKKEPDNRCRADAIGVSGRHQCDSYLQLQSCFSTRLIDNMLEVVKTKKRKESHESGNKSI